MRTSDRRTMVGAAFVCAMLLCVGSPAMGGDPVPIEPGVLAHNVDLKLWDNVPGVAYSVSQANPDVRYARLEGGSWKIELADSNDANNPLLAYDQDGTPHLVYPVNIDQEGWHAKWTGSSWQKTQIQTNIFSQHAFVNCDPGNFLVAYNSDSHNGGPGYYRKYVNGSWLPRVKISPTITDWSDMAVSAAGRVGLVGNRFTWSSPGELRYYEGTCAGFTSTGWDPIQTPYSVRAYCIAKGGAGFDSKERVYVTFGNRASEIDPWTVYLTWSDDGVNWHFPPVALPGTDQAADSDLFVYNDVPYVIYGVNSNGTDCDLVLASYVGGQWESFSPTPDRVTRKATFEIDDTGTAHIAYLAQVRGGGEPRYVTFDVGPACTPYSQDFPGPALPADWLSIGNGEWTWSPEGNGIAKQIHQADDNLSAYKLLNQHFEDFVFTVRWRQDSGPIISSGVNIWFRMGDDPGPGANVPGIGPHYWLGWTMTPANYGHPDFKLGYCEGWYEYGPNRYGGVGCDRIAEATLNTPQPWFGFGDWRRTRVSVDGDTIRAYIDRDSSNPANDKDSDFELVFDVTDSRLSGGTVAFNDHYAKTSWDYAHIVPFCTGDLNCDGQINFEDIDPFVLALSGQAAHQAVFTGCRWLNADCNGDGQVDFDDIDPFVALLGG